MAEEFLESEIVFSDSDHQLLNMDEKFDHKEIKFPIKPANSSRNSQLQQVREQIWPINNTAVADHLIQNTTPNQSSSHLLIQSKISTHNHHQQQVIVEDSGGDPNSSSPMKIPETEYDRRRTEEVDEVYSDDEDGEFVSVVHYDHAHPHRIHIHHHPRLVPPHVILARRIAKSVASSSVHIENGRALRVRARGRSLYQVRDSILRMTGFIES